MLKRKRIGSSKPEDQGNRAFPKIAHASLGNFDFSAEEDGLNSHCIEKLKQKNALVEFQRVSAIVKRKFVAPPFPPHWFPQEESDEKEKPVEIRDLFAMFKDFIKGKRTSVHEAYKLTDIIPKGSQLRLYPPGALIVTCRKKAS